MAVLREYKFACKGYNICCMARFFIAYALFFALKSTLSGLVAGEGVVVAALGAVARRRSVFDAELLAQFRGRLPEGFAIALGEVGRRGEAHLVGYLGYRL